MAAPLTLLLPALLAGCDFPWEAGSAAAPDDTAAAVVSDCDPVVYVPYGDDSQAAVASPHDAVFGAEAPDPYHVRYQWPSRDPSTSAAFLWRTDTETLSSLVEYGPAEGFPDNAVRVEGYTFLYAGAEVNSGPYRIHEAHLCGVLEPGTTYAYRVGGDGHWSDTFEFTTPGSPGSFDSFRVAIAGDSRGDYATWGAILTAMEAHDPDLILFSGDMVELGANQAEWDQWFEAAGDLLATTPLVAAHGNHEFLANNYFAQFAFPGNEEWFAVEYGPLLVLSLNDTVRTPEHIDSTQRSFLEQELAATTLPWRIAMHHQPAYSTCTTHGSDLDVRAAWSDVLESRRVQLVTAGHNHIYERSVPIYLGEQAPADQGTVYLVSGGAGAPLYEQNDVDWYNAVANPVEHYVIGDFGPDGAELVVRDLDGNVIDSFSLAP